MKLSMLITIFFACLAIAEAQPSGLDARNAERSARDVIDRITPGVSSAIRIEFIKSEGGNDAFEIASEGTTLILRGSNALSVTAAWNWYLRNMCHAEVSWCGDQLRLPRPLPPLTEKVRVKSPYKYRYMYNYCTFSYTMAFWDWKQWERELDYLALNGVNFPLAITGQEAVWQNLYKKMGLSDSAITAFLAGPAYLAWGWMGNLDGWGGPSPQSWIDGQRLLQTKILKRMRDLGMTPVLPAFSGHVPSAIRTLYPRAEIKPLNWDAGFGDTYVLSPTDPLFLKIGAAFLQEQQRLYGTDHYYSADTFNENRPPTNDSTFLARSSEAVYRSMTAVDSRATWVMQGWLFFNDQDFWKEPQVKAVLGAVPDTSMIILDLYCDVSPVWKRTDAFYGKQWIWCSLHNFGGNSSLQGNMTLIASEPPRLLRDPHRGKLCGIGMTMEGTHHNPMYYDLMMEMLWTRDSPDLQQWVRTYSTRRNGKSSEKATQALDLLFKSVYARVGRIDIGGMLCARPSLFPRGEWVTPDIAYDPLDLVRAWGMMVDCSGEMDGSGAFGYDLVDIGRQVLSNLSTQLHMQLIEAAARNKPEEFRAFGEQFLQLLRDLDALLGTRREFLLGRWIEDAKAWGTNSAERNLMEWNARNQITLWGEKNSPLHEYARKEWSGLIRGFYLPRWERYLRELESAMNGRATRNDSLFTEQIKTWEESWTRSRDAYPSKPEGDPISVSRRLLAKYSDLCKKAYLITPNLATGKQVTVSGGTEGDYRPEFAVDGRIDLSSRWSASPYPQWLQVDLGGVDTISHIQVLPYWDGKRYYQYFVEVSPDGNRWTTVADMRQNTVPANILGHDHRFQPITARFARITMTYNSANKGVHLVELRLFPR